MSDAAPEVVFDPAQLGRIEAAAPGETAAILRLFRADLARSTVGLQTGDREALRRIAHRLKGSAGSIGAGVVAARARDLEGMCRTAGVDLTAACVALREAAVVFLERPETELCALIRQAAGG